MLFDPFESIVLFFSVLTVNYVVQDGKSNWLEGMILICLCVRTFLSNCLSLGAEALTYWMPGVGILLWRWCSGSILGRSRLDSSPVRHNVCMTLLYLPHIPFVSFFIPTLSPHFPISPPDEIPLLNHFVCDA